MRKAEGAAPTASADPAWWSPTNLEGVFTLFTAMVGLVTGFLALVSVLPPNSVQLYPQPYVNVGSLPHAVPVAGTLTAIYSDLSSPANLTTACGGACLLDPYNASASAACGLGAGAPIDHFVQIFFRIVTFTNGTLVTADIDLGLPFGVRIAASVACGVVGFLSVIVLLVHPRTVFRNKQVVPQRDLWFYLPMFNILRGFIAVFLFTFATVIADVLIGEVVFQDLWLDGALTLMICALALVRESRVGAFLSISHSPAYEKEANMRTHEAHYVAFPIVMVLYFGTGLLVLLQVLLRGVRAYNYGLADPGLVTVYNGAVLFQTNYGGRVLAITLCVLQVVYNILLPLPGIIAVVEVMNGRAHAYKTTFQEYVDLFRFCRYARPPPVRAGSRSER